MPLDELQRVLRGLVLDWGGVGEVLRPDGCIPVDAQARRGTVDVPIGVGIQTAIEDGLLKGWSLQSDLWQVRVGEVGQVGTTWWTPAVVAGPSGRGVATWVGPDAGATKARPAPPQAPDLQQLRSATEQPQGIAEVVMITDHDPTARLGMQERGA